MSKLQRQIALEEESLGLGIKKYQEMVRTAKEKGRESSLPPSVRLMEKFKGELIEAIIYFIQESESGKAGVKRIVYLMLAKVDPEVSINIALRVMFDTISSKQQGLQKAAIAIGSQIESEFNYTTFKKANSGLYRAIEEDFKKRNVTALHFVKRTIRAAFVKDGHEWVYWNKTEKFKLGEYLIHLVVEVTGYFELQKVTQTKGRKQQTSTIIVPKEEVLVWMESQHVKNEVLRPYHLPMIMPPVKWTGLKEGGYVVQEVSLIKSYNQDYLKSVESENIDKVFDVINTLQETPWVINKKILEVMHDVKQKELKLGKLPSPEPLPEPARPTDYYENKEVANAWAKEIIEIRAMNKANISKSIALSKKLWIADKFKEEEEIFFPKNLDYRGREYCIPLILNPQGDDVSKALLTFATGKKINNDGACWLAIHGANLFGYDKVTLQERVDWVTDNEDEILASASDPIENLFWHEADKPWQFLSFCYEWEGFHKDGFEFNSSLPVAMDGSCNGLQHFSAMLRDSEGGKAVNLVPSELPNDVYQKVADEVNNKLKEKIEAGDVEAKKWEGKVDRRLTKRPVMTSVYGSKAQGTIDHIEEEVGKQIDNGEVFPFPKKCRAEATYLAPIVREAIGDTMQAASQAMDWLQDTVRVASKENKYVQWKTPVGFPVRQECLVPLKKRIESVINGKRYSHTLTIGEKGLDKHKQASSIAANFVHSMDAAHMMLTVLRAKEHGVTHFAMVHDSYGTHAADAKIMEAAIRETFIEMYEQHDVLQELKDNIEIALSEKAKKKLKPVPAKGDLELRVVKDSDYFFA